MKTNQSIVIIPTYNEKENIENIIRAVMALEDNFNILIIDDGSPDGTAAIVKGLMETDFKDRLFIVERSGKLGLGTAYITGFKWCIERGYDYIFEMDADFSHAPADLPRLLNACRKVINTKEDQRETLLSYARTINEEIRIKRREFNLPLD